MPSEHARLTNALESMRRRTAARIAEIAAAQDAVLLDGRLVPRADAGRRYRRLRLRSWLTLAELALAWVIVAYVAFFPLFLLAYLMGPF